MRSDTERSPASGEHRPTAERTAAALTNVATLLPTQVPGRLTRKARHYLPQIIQLRAQGYTLEAIQQALAAVGVPVSISTVRREAMRPLPSAHMPAAATAAALLVSRPAPTASLPAAPTPSAASPVIPGCLDSGKDIAAAYAHTKSSNALTRAKERS